MYANNKHLIHLVVNGDKHDLVIEPKQTLLEVLREGLGLIGAKEGCGEGACGSCTVLVNGKPYLSCLTLAVAVNGYEITTIEGLAENGGLHKLQQAFIDYGAIQCGFCTPGLVMTAKSLYDKNSNPSEEDVKEAIGGNLCRCTGYTKVVEAILSVKKPA